jgi:predicted secreted hydrolase
VFPGDHGSHPDYRIEWWYFTGHLDTESGRTFGYQLTFFRLGVSRKPVVAGPWALRDVWMAHLALSHLGEEQFVCFQRFNRAGPGVAGASETGFDTWNEDWKGKTLPGGDFSLEASDQSEGSRHGIALRLSPGKPPVFHGDRGYSRKGKDPGNASLYVSLTRMPTSGTVFWKGVEEKVTGFTWMDHEFGTSVLEAQQQGWDWLSLQGEDGSELMIFQLRRKDGTLDANGAGTWVPAEGAPLPLASSDFVMEPGRTWSSPRTEGVYPVEWKVRVPRLDMEMELKASFPGQELAFGGKGVAYWEGSVSAEGRRGGSPWKARGYLEMTGYSGSPMGELFQGN